MSQTHPAALLFSGPSLNTRQIFKVPSIPPLKRLMTNCKFETEM